MTDTLYIIGLVILAALQPLDVWSTNRVIANGGHESNPILAAAMRRLGKAWPWFKLGAVAIAIYLLWGIGPRWESWVVLVALIAAFVWVVQHNIAVAKRQEARRK